MQVSYNELARIGYTMGYSCAGCGWMGRAAVQGRGFASSKRAGEHLSEAAQAAALRNAEMRCELARCPGCGRRGWGTFLRAWGRNVAIYLGVTAALALVGWVRIRGSDWWWVVAFLGVVFQVGLAVVFALDFWASTRVQFLPEEPEEAPAAGSAYRSPPEL
ncbi:Hypothetical protein A7982_03561 [Minicystis rosea]|nr:Hypothetical protein A7982_03561 [Minicystis rosea]